MTITAAADGSALSNPGPAGWAWYVDDDCWAAGGWEHGTNNMGELMAVLNLLQQTAHTGEALRVLCDSQYVINSVTKWLPGWKRKGWRKADGKPVLNVELLKELDAALAHRDVSFEWVKGHAGHAMNEAADARARAVATAFPRGTSYDAGPGFAGSAATAESLPVVPTPPARPEPALFSFAPGPERAAPAKVSVRQAAADDARLLRPLTLAFGFVSRPLSEAEFEQRLAEVLSRGWLVLVAEVDGQAVGYAAAQDYGPGLRARFTTARLHDLFVDESVRHRGVAQALKAGVEAGARGVVAPMILDWQATPESVGFYERLGHAADRVGDYGSHPGFCLDCRAD